MTAENASLAEELFSVGLECWPPYTVAVIGSQPNCPCCGGKLLTVSELIATTATQEWRVKQFCMNRITSGCP